MANRKCVGRAWIGDRKKIIYSCQEITRGKDRGKYRVEYLNGTYTEGPDKGKFRYKKQIVLPDELVLDQISTPATFQENIVKQLPLKLKRRIKP